MCQNFVCDFETGCLRSLSAESNQPPGSCQLEIVCSPKHRSADHAYFCLSTISTTFDGQICRLPHTRRSATKCSKPRRRSSVAPEIRTGFPSASIQSINSTRCSTEETEQRNRAAPCKPVHVSLRGTITSKVLALSSDTHLHFSHPTTTPFFCTLIGQKYSQHGLRTIIAETIPSLTQFQPATVFEQPANALRFLRDDHDKAAENGRSVSIWIRVALARHPRSHVRAASKPCMRAPSSFMQPLCHPRVAQSAAGLGVICRRSSPCSSTASRTACTNGRLTAPSPTRMRTALTRRVRRY